MTNLKYTIRQNLGMLLAITLFVVMFTIYVTNHQAGLNPNVVATAANKGVLLALVAMAQTLPILTAGLDLSVGMVFILANSLASALVSGSPLETAVGIVIVLIVSLLCGMLNGLIVVYGRLQPIITTLATGSVFFGAALVIRPSPGGTVNEDLADALAYDLMFGVIPPSLLVLLGVIVFIWMPFRRSTWGRAMYAAGSAESAGYMSGLNVNMGKFMAYSLAGLFSGIAGLMLTFMTYAGEANAALGGTYTLNSIASVVIGGTSLFGGAGGVIGSVFGAFVFRTIGDLLFVFDLDALYQPLFIGLVLLVSVSMGSIRLLKVKNRLELFK
ncbi:MAG TPA: ABC transporter permease [Kiloniellales bacterium]